MQPKIRELRREEKKKIFFSSKKRRHEPGSEVKLSANETLEN